VTDPSATSLTLNVVLGVPPQTGAFYDSTTVPGAPNDFATYTWNQSATAMFGGCGDGTVVDDNHRTLPADGTYAKPQTMETAHHAMDRISSMLQAYAQNVQDSADAITGSCWSGPSADAFTQVVKAFCKYLTDMAAPMERFVREPENLYTLAQRLDLAGRAASTIWDGSLVTVPWGIGHDRDTPVTLSGAVNFSGRMVDAGWTMLADLDTHYKAVLD
jgi:uncharacterized protein YukE